MSDPLQLMEESPTALNSKIPEIFNDLKPSVVQSSFHDLYFLKLVAEGSGTCRKTAAGSSADGHSVSKLSLIIVKSRDLTRDPKIGPKIKVNR